MKDMPEKAKKYYKWFINSHPESYHPTTLDFFYMFLSVLLSYSKKTRTQGWLEENLKEDSPQLSRKDIQKYGGIYKHIRDFRNVNETQTAKLLAQSIHETGMAEARRKYLK